MATVTGIGGDGMVPGLAGGNAAVVTRNTLVGGLAVVERRYQCCPLNTRAMTGIALIGRQWMVTRFTGGDITGMTTATHIGRLAVIKRRDQRRPRLTCRMTRTTSIRG